MASSAAGWAKAAARIAAPMAPAKRAWGEVVTGDPSSSPNRSTTKAFSHGCGGWRWKCATASSTLAQDAKGYSSGTQLGAGSFFGRRAGRAAAAAATG